MRVSTRSVAIAAGALITAAIALAAIVVPRDAWPTQPKAKHGNSDPGRLQGGAPVAVGQPVEVGQPFSDGLLWVTNSGSTSITLDRVSLIERDPKIKVVGVYLKRNNQHAVGFNRGYTTRWGERFRGAVVAPGELVQIVIGLALFGSGAHLFRAISVTYHTSSEQTTGSFPVAARMCAPVASYENHRCSAPVPLVK